MFDLLTLSLDAFVPLYHGAETGWFPVERIPDGSIWYPHHFWTGVFVALVAIYADRRDGSAWVTVAGLGVAVYGWLFLWHKATSPFWGAAFSLFGVTVATLAVAVAPYWRHYSLREYPRFVRADFRRAWRVDLRAVPRRVAGAIWWVVTHPVAAVGRVVTPRTVALLGVLIAADDAVDHALPVTTPLQWFWVNHGHRLAADVTRFVTEAVVVAALPF